LHLFCIFFQALYEQPHGSIHQLQNTAVPLIWHKTPEDEMTISDDCDLQNDQRDGSSCAMCSTVMDCKEVDVKEDDVSQSLFARHSYDMDHDRFRGACEVERVQEVEDTECKYTCDQMNSESSSAKESHDCDVRHLTFSDSKCLGKHTRIHSRVKTFVCDVCDKAFTRSGNLQQHKRFHFHTGKTPHHETRYHCDVCNKAFAYSNCLQQHKRSHTGYTPYHCDACNRAFTTSTGLKSHRRSHTGTGETPNHCD